MSRSTQFLQPKPISDSPEIAICWAVPPLADPMGQSNRSGKRLTRAKAIDRGGDNLKSATSLRPYLQGYALPGVNRPLRDRTGRKDPDFYRLFDNASSGTFQSAGLLLSCNLVNLSNHPISIALLNRQGNLIAGSQTTVSAGTSFVYPDQLSNNTFYIKITSSKPGQNRYDLNLSIINS